MAFLVTNGMQKALTIIKEGLFVIIYILITHQS